MNGLYCCIVCGKQVVVQEYLEKQIREVERLEEIDILKSLNPKVKTDYIDLIIQALEMCNEKKVYTIPTCHGVFKLVY